MSQVLTAYQAEALQQIVQLDAEVWVYRAPWRVVLVKSAKVLRKFRWDTCLSLRYKGYLEIVPNHDWRSSGYYRYRLTEKGRRYGKTI